VSLCCSYLAQHKLPKNALTPMERKTRFVLNAPTMIGVANHASG
jgi:hypothetical protein